MKRLSQIVVGGVFAVTLLFGSLLVNHANSVHAATRNVSPPHHIACSEEWIDDGFHIVGQNDTPDGQPEILRNDTGGSVVDTVTTSASLTVSVTVSGGLEFQAGTLIAQAKTTLGLSLQTSVTISRSESRAINILPFTHVSFGEYIHQDTISFHHYFLLANCSIGTDDGWQTLQAPEYKFWWAKNV